MDEHELAGRHLPLLTLAVVVGCLVADALDPLGAWLELDRTAVAAGQVWRLWSGHLVHELPNVAWTDLPLLALLGAWIERRSRTLLGTALLASATLSSLGFLLTDGARYVGSSGLVMGLLGAGLVLLHRDGRRALSLIALGVLGAKLFLEAIGRWPMTPGGLPEGYRVAPLAHLGGVLGGALATLAVLRRQAARGVDANRDSPAQG